MEMHFKGTFPKRHHLFSSFKQIKKYKEEMYNNQNPACLTLSWSSKLKTKLKSFENFSKYCIFMNKPVLFFFG